MSLRPAGRPGPGGVLFDKDGTLFDFQATWGRWADDMIGALSGSDRALGDEIAARLRFDRVTRRFDPGSPVIAGTPEEAARLIAPCVGITQTVLVARMNAAAAQVDVVPPVPLAPLLARLRGAGLALGVATNDGEAPARAHLARAGILDAFDFVCGYDGPFAPKPAPDMCFGFAAHAGLDPADCVMIGDSLHDLQAGRAAGMRCVAVLTGPARREDLAPRADAVLDHVGQLPDWLGLGAR